MSFSKLFNIVITDIFGVANESNIEEFLVLKDRLRQVVLAHKATHTLDARANYKKRVPIFYIHDIAEKWRYHTSISPPKGKNAFRGDLVFKKLA